MNIELKQAAQDAAEAIDWLLKNIRLDAPQLSGKAMGNAEKCAIALRTALAQRPATATACGIPGMAKTTCPYCDQEFAFEHEQPATPERVPMTDEQINEMALQEEFLLVCDGVEELTEIVRAVEAHYGITAQAKKEDE